MPNNSQAKVSPVAQFALLLTPMVMTCFYLVYSLTGWILDGKDKLNWSLEALEVGGWVCVGIVAYCLVVMLYAKLKKASWYHILMISSYGHILVAILLTASIYITVRL